MSLQRYFKNRERQKFFATINSSLFESRNPYKRDEEKLLEDTPSTSKNDDIERLFQPKSTLCVFLEAIDGVWTECERVGSRPLTQKLQEIVLRKHLLFALNAQKLSSPVVCNHHWRLIWSSEATSFENLGSNLNVHQQQYEGGLNGQNGNDCLSIEHQDDENVALNTLDFEINEKKKRQKYKRRNGEMDDSDSDNDQPDFAKISRISSRQWVENLIEYSKNTATDEFVYCEECSYNPEAPCNVARPQTVNEIKTKLPIDEENRTTVLRQRLAEIGTRQEIGDDEEDDDHLLSMLSAAALRRYRKHFEIPTKPSATKHAMLDGVISHFESMPANAGEAIAHFIAATNQSEKRPHPGFTAPTSATFNRSRRFQ